MAKINIKTNFVDGEKLFAQQLNNNFKAIQEGMNSDNKIIWQDGEEVLFKRYVTNDIESLPILDGSIIYDVEKGRHYIDYNGNRIQVGSAGKEVLVQEEQPTEEDNKIWIESDFVNTMGTEVVDSLEGDEANMAPSVRAVKKGIKDIYTEEETLIGEWKGKPLYRKVIQFDKTINMDTVLSIDTGINNADLLFIENAFIYNNTGTVAEGNRLSFKIPFNNAPNESNYIGCRLNGNKVELVSNGGWNNFWTKVIILNYTKTTDSEVISNEV